ncbi:MAG: helix-turn-helix domain-containing protein [Flavobacteriales bacterium]|jgi:excisionase family DNA binding protein|nr:helix-turn-helix domain-containing protein [Flavobacteriales bacterium]
MNEYTIIKLSVAELETLIKKTIEKSLSNVNSKSTPNEIYPNFMDTEGAMNYLGVSKSTIYKMTMNREVPFYKPTGKRNYFRRNELDEWLLKHRVKSLDEIEQEAADYLLKKEL